MPDLLLELRSEEIPARMQRKAAGDLKKLLTDGLVEAGLTYEGAREYWTPRRLTLDIRGLTARSRDLREERKGPSTKAPEQAVQGFLRSAGLSSVEEAEIRTDPKKGDFYVAIISSPGRAAEEIIADVMPGIIRNFPWPKSMRWGLESARPGSLRWVRPLQSILCTFGPETEEPVVVDFEIDGICAGNITYGHRFHAPDAITVRRFDDYVAKLEAAKVVLDAERRKEIILADAKNLAFASGLELVEDDGLLDEVSGLVEWPVVLMGEFEEDFLTIPPEIIRLTIRANQKCFVTRPQENAGRQRQLSNRFLLTANIEAKDGGAEIAHGNGKVVRARLSDALHFWKTDQANLPDLDRLKASAEKLGLDLAKPLDQRMARLDHLNVTFHAKLGTQGERVERIARLAEELAPIIERSISPSRGEATQSPAAPPFSRRPTSPPKSLASFQNCRELIGRKYAALQGEHPSVAAAIEEHYKPQGPSDRVPTDPVSIAVALADKLDTLVGFWAIDEKPTGSKDPYALRRAALGVIRIAVENGVRLGLDGMFILAHRAQYDRILRSRLILDEADPTDYELQEDHPYELYGQYDRRDAALQEIDLDEGFKFGRFENQSIAGVYDFASRSAVATDLLSFFHDRLKVYLRDQGARHDLIDAVLASGASPTSPLRGGRTEGPGGGNSSSAGASEPPPLTPPHKGEGNPQSSNDDLLLIVRRVEALGSFLDTEDGKNLLAGTKRAANILAAEEKKGTAIAEAVDPALFTEPAEKALFSAMNQAEKEAGQAIQKQDFSAAMQALSVLRGPVDNFFEKVLVNADDRAVRANRLALLARIRGATGQVADFSKISG